MNTTVQKILELNLAKGTAEAKSFDDLNQYLGGVGLGLKLMELYLDKNPIIFAVGPLNGFFPYAAKTAVLIRKKGIVEDMYLGGSLSLRMRFAGLNALVIYGKAPKAQIVNIFNDAVKFEKSPTETKDLGLPGKRSVLEFYGKYLTVDKYFRPPKGELEKSLIERNLAGLVLTGTKTFTPKSFPEYTALYENLLSKRDLLRVNPSDKPSCSGCPLGCEGSQTGSVGGNIFTHSLVTCDFAENLYADIGLVFSCLNVLGYDYTHEDLEQLPNLVEQTLKNINNG